MRSFAAVRSLLPPILVFLGLLAAAAGTDALLHRLGLAPVGRWLGPVGAGLLAVSFLHSLRKRRLLRAGSPKFLLALHEVLALVGSFVLVVHAGIHVHAWIPWAAVAALIVVVASGLTGKFLLVDARRGLAERRAALKDEGLGDEEVERRLLLDALLVDRMQRWRAVHMPLTAVLAALALVHVAATLVLW